MIPKKEVSISVKNLGKKFTLGKESSSTFREQLLNLFQKKQSDETREFWALKNVSFELYKGDVLGIVGKNGSGKSTLLKILSKITPPTEGEIEINGKLSSLLEVGTGFHPELTGRENIFLNGSILGMTKKDIEKQFENIVEFAGVSKFLDTPVKRYSSGMYVRLAFAVAAHLEPEILIVDEVLAVGDHEFQKKCLGKMNEVASKGRTVIFVSHNMGAVAELCNRAILLNQGEILDDSRDVSQVINSYVGKYRGNGLTMFDDPSNEVCQFTKIATLNKGNKSSSFDLSEEINIQIDFELKEIVQGLRIGLILKKENINEIFYTFNNEEEYEFSNLQIGHNSFTYTIPPMFLKEGEYQITLTLGNTGNCFEKKESCLNFTVENHFVNTENKGYKKERNGLVIGPGTWIKNN
jgi:lipopolysaccharide transport system ATP-binding protein